MSKVRVPLFDLSPPKEDCDVLDSLKWMISVMDRDDKSLMFVASLLSGFIKWGGLTDKQAAGAAKVYERVLGQFERGVLAIQGGGPTTKDDGRTNVTHLSSRRGTGAA